ncbi:MAG: hypothetical protein HY046_10750 [Acidobacteria bacterium]|nr:hypothetical protein [Acidobacteriota bacterium]
MSEAATPAMPQETAQPEAPKLKTRKLRQRACDEKVEKGKVCCGHLKRWYDYPKEIEAIVGGRIELYRCENCKALYKADPHEMPRSYTQRF